MNVASESLSRYLHQVLGWTDTEKWYSQLSTGQFVVTDWDTALRVEGGESFPAYDLGYLLRKLPKFLNHGHGPSSLDFGPDDPDESDGWTIGYMGGNIFCVADTPEDAAAKLAIALFKQGILTRTDAAGGAV